MNFIVEAVSVSLDYITHFFICFSFVITSVRTRRVTLGDTNRWNFRFDKLRKTFFNCLWSGSDFRSQLDPVEISCWFYDAKELIEFRESIETGLINQQNFHHQFLSSGCFIVEAKYSLSEYLQWLKNSFVSLLVFNSRTSKEVKCEI